MYYKNLYIKLFLKIVICLLSLVFGCTSTKYVPKDKYLLARLKIKTNNKQIKPKDLEPYIRQKPNKKSLNILNLPLWLYNISSSDTNKWLNRTLRKVGEEPVVYDSTLAERGKEQIQQYLFNNGYFDGVIKKDVVFKKRKAIIIFTIDTKKPYKISKILYTIEDSSLHSILISDTSKCKIKQNSIFNIDILQEERQRIEYLFRNNGYYAFSKDYINFELDTFKINNSIIINTIIKNPIIKSGSGEIIKTSHQKYIINDLQVWIDNQRASDTLNYNPDSIMYDIHTINDISYFFRDKINIRPEILANHIFINRNNPFKQKDVDETFNGLSSLQIFKFINIGFIESSAPSENNDSNKTLDCKIQLITQNTQLIQPEFELTSNIGLGASGKLSYKHRNIFKGAEIFYIRLKGTSEAIKSKEKLDFKNTLEYSIESGIDIPKFVVPFNATMFIREYNPHTNISGSFNYIRRIHYTHQFFNTSFGYIWNAYKGNKRFQVNLIDLNYVKLLKYDSVFLQSISNSYLKYTFEDHLVSMSSFSYSYAKSLVKLNPFFYVRYNCEFAGNTLRTIMKTFDYKQNSDGSYDLFGIRYAQFIRSDIDFRYYIPIDKVTNIVFRTFVGVAYPYGNSRTIPFEKQYFAGGANSMRGWAIRSLGPGSYRDSVAQAYPDKASDLKIEANFEYRFKMFWKLEGALFVDIGNIWSISKDEKREGAKFTFSNFYNQFAVGSGIGTRLNFSFLIFRVDWGIKVIDPSQESKNKLVLLKYKDVNYSFWDIINPVIGIGYPF